MVEHSFLVKMEPAGVMASVGFLQLFLREPTDSVQDQLVVFEYFRVAIIKNRIKTLAFLLYASYFGKVAWCN